MCLQVLADRQFVDSKKVCPEAKDEICFLICETRPICANVLQSEQLCECRCLQTGSLWIAARCALRPKLVCSPSSLLAGSVTSCAKATGESRISTDIFCNFGFLVRCMCESHFHHHLRLDPQPYVPRLQLSHARCTVRLL